MPSIEKHVEGSSKRTSKSYREVHEWIDDPDHKNERHDITRRNFFDFVPVETPESIELGNPRLHQFAGQLRNGHVRAEPDGAIEHAADGDTPEEVVVIEVRHLQLQDALRVASRGRD